jgi:hypothetical protein
VKCCAICNKPVGGQATAKAKSGKICHASCLARAVRAGTAGNAGKAAATQAPRQWDTRAAEKAFEQNRAAVLAGETFRGHKASTWRVGGSPSSTGDRAR